MTATPGLWILLNLKVAQSFGPLYPSPGHTPRGLQGSGSGQLLATMHEALSLATQNFSKFPAILEGNKDDLMLVKRLPF